ncbi:hypothetical protein [Nonomuraea jabiensis]|uniref:hypothetical protein n=1 Tax=Nonomuraea jabiensis TaxID=882448 RepID=UPI003D72518E
MPHRSCGGLSIRAELRRCAPSPRSRASRIPAVRRVSSATVPSQIVRQAAALGRTSAMAWS